MTDAISRNSITMAKCSTAYNGIRFSNFGKILQQLWFITIIDKLE
jgi:hypothetical protein